MTSWTFFETVNRAHDVVVPFWHFLQEEKIKSNASVKHILGVSWSLRCNDFDFCLVVTMINVNMVLYLSNQVKSLNVIQNSKMEVGKKENSLGLTYNFFPSNNHEEGESVKPWKNGTTNDAMIL